jgi:hypothetical protein
MNSEARLGDFSVRGAARVPLPIAEAAEGLGSDVAFFSSFLLPLACL